MRKQGHRANWTGLCVNRHPLASAKLPLQAGINRQSSHCLSYGASQPGGRMAMSSNNRRMNGVYWLEGLFGQSLSKRMAMSSNNRRMNGVYWLGGLFGQSLSKRMAMSSVHRRMLESLLGTSILSRHGQSEMSAAQKSGVGRYIAAMIDARQPGF
eukprot:391188-Pelagomonas_calceolata.AAC.2